MDTTLISQKTNELSDVDFVYSTTSDFSYINTLDDGCSAIVLEATVVYFEFKNIQSLLKTGKRLAARVYKIYQHALQDVCRNTGGYFNCYSPTSFLMIYPKEKYDISYVVDVAIKTADLISVGLRDCIEKHTHNNFSMGIDFGNVLGTKTCCENKYTQTVWFGHAIEKAAVISGLCQRPFFVGVSGTVFHHLNEDLLKTTKRILGIKKSVDIWTRVSYQLDNVKHHLYQTNFHRSFEGGEIEEK